MFNWLKTITTPVPVRPANVELATFPDIFEDQIVANSEFDSWTGSAADGFNLSGGTWGGNPGANQVAADGSAGTGACRLVGTSTLTAKLSPAVVLTQNGWYQVEIFFSGGANPNWYSFQNGTTQIFTFAGQIRPNRLIFKSTLGTSFTLQPIIAPADMAIDYWRIVPITPMPLQQAPSPDCTIEQSFTLSTEFSLINHDQLSIMHHVQTEADYENLKCMYLQSQSGWQVQATSVVNDVSTTKHTTNSIPVRPDTIRIISNGIDRTIETVTNGVVAVLGTYQNTSYPAAPLFRSMWTTGITPTALRAY